MGRYIARRRAGLRLLNCSSEEDGERLRNGEREADHEGPQKQDEGHCDPENPANRKNGSFTAEPAEADFNLLNG